MEREEKQQIALNSGKPIGISIRTKLMGVISLILLISVYAVSSLGTFFFSKDTQARVQENNLVLIRILGQKVESDLSSIQKTLSLVAEALENSETEEKKEGLSSLYFSKKSEFLYLGLAKKKEDSLVVIDRLYNRPFFNSHNLTDRDMEDINLQHSMSFLQSFKSAFILMNASPAFKLPVMAISFPFKNIRGENVILIAYIRSESILKAFRGGGISMAGLVDSSGKVLAHPDEELVLKAKDLQAHPIINVLLKLKEGISSQRIIDLEGKEFFGSALKLSVAGIGVYSLTEKDVALEEVKNIQRRNLYLTIIVLSLTLIFIYIYSLGITSPILKLATFAREIERGNYTHFLQPKTKDELGLLTHSFNSMSKGLDEREKMKDAFGKFVNKELAELAMKGDIKLGGERKYCAIFFSDIRSFTSISEKLEPEEVVEFLNQYMTEMVTCVNQTSGIVDKFIGDAIMATWGALHHLDNETENAINAALMMRKALIRFNKGRGGDKKPIIKIGCGINSGYVISGQIGSHERLEYTVIGDAVNLASRVEALNKPFGTDILITEESYSKVKGLYRVEKMQAIKVKGKEKPQQIYAVISRFDDPNGYNSLAELREAIGIILEEKKQDKNTEGEEVKYEILE